MWTSLLSLLPFIALTAYASTTVKNATYDDLEAQVVSVPIGTYDDLVYNAFVLNSATGSSVPVGGLALVSPPNRIISQVQDRLTNGTASFTVAKPYKSLGLLDFFFGCTARTPEGTVALAAECTITVAGFLRGSDKEVALASFTFTPPPNPVTPVPMIHAVLPDTFEQPIFNVTVQPDDDLLSVLIDNLHYSVST